MFTRMKNRIKDFPRPLLVVVGIFLIMGAVAVFAANELTPNQQTWIQRDEDPAKKYATPSEYNYDGVDRLYAYMTWAKFGYKIKLGGGAEAVRAIDTMYVPSFDHKFEPGETYYDTGQAAVPADEVSRTLKDSYFDPLNWPFLSGGRYYDLSDRPGGWKDTVGNKEWNRAANMYPMGINVTRTKGDGYTDSGRDRTPNDNSTYGDPQRVKDGDGSASKPADVGWVYWKDPYKKILAQEFVYKKSNGPITYTDMDGSTVSTPGDVGWWGMTWWAGKMLVSPQNVAGGYLDAAVAQDYNIKLMDLRHTYFARTPGEKDRFTVSLVNQMPFDVRNVHLRAYIQEKGKAPVPIYNETAPKLRGYGRGWDAEGPQAICVSKEFEAPVPAGPPGGEAPQYEIIATANIYYQSGWVNQNLVSDWRNSGGHKIFGDSGAAETNYVDNVQKVALVGGKPITPPPTPEPPKTDNLTCTEIQVFDDKNQSVTQVVTGKPYKVMAVFTSSFPFEGWVKMRLYEKNDYGWKVVAGDSDNYIMPANGTKTMEWGWSPGTSKQATLTASIAYKSSNGETWAAEPFEGRTESTYDDNKKDLAIGIGEPPPYQPLNLKVEWPIYYWPTKTVIKAVYEDVVVEKEIIYYKPVPVINLPPRPKYRLIPNQE